MAEWIDITSWEGGLNTRKPPAMIADDQLAAAYNVEWTTSPLGERRRGTRSITITGDLASAEKFAYIARHTPTNSDADAELWGVALDNSGTTAVVGRKTTAWTTVTLADTMATPATYAYQSRMVSLHGKNFFAYKSSVDRLHVWDGSTLRVSGLDAPAAAPTATDDGSGSFSGTRYYRVRAVVVSGTTVTRRGEASPEVTFNPLGTGSGAVVTKPTLPGEGETHWELEASVSSGSDFRRIARTVIATSTVTDTELYSDAYGDYPTSEDSGDYTLLPSVRLLAVDDDRLLCGGSYEDAALDSEVLWTPVGGDITGAGNDERVPIDTNNRLNLDGREGGGLTDLISGTQGYSYAFKWKRTYKLVRTGVRSKAYEAYPITKERGALPGSAVNGLDEAGRPATFFLDPAVGPCIIGANGLQQCGEDILPTWQELFDHEDYTVAATATYDSASAQVRWFIATNGGSGFPDTGIILHTKQMRPEKDGYHRGLVLWTTRDIAASCMFSSNIDDDTARSVDLVPFYAGADAPLIYRSNVGDEDDGIPFSTLMTSKSFAPYGLLVKTGCGSGVILGLADDAANATVTVSRNHGQTGKPVDVVFAQAGDQSHCVRTLDNLNISEASTIEVEVSDDGQTSRWELSRIMLKLRSEHKS